MLAIGGYESAWLADMAIAYIFEQSKEEIKELLFKAKYKDNGLGIMKEKKLVEQMNTWLRKCQSKNE